MSFSTLGFETDARLTAGNFAGHDAEPNVDRLGSAPCPEVIAKTAGARAVRNAGGRIALFFVGATELKQARRLHGLHAVHAVDWLFACLLVLPVYKSLPCGYAESVMGKKIIDQYTGLRANYSRQYLWQLRKRAQGKCIICGAPADQTSYCEIHQLKTYRRYLIHYKRKKPIRKLSAKMQRMLDRGLSLPAPLARLKQAAASKPKPTAKTGRGPGGKPGKRGR
jgi:hypothetical protein